MNKHDNMVKVSDNVVEIYFIPIQVNKSKIAEMGFVIDFTRYNEIIGIEIINLFFNIKKIYPNYMYTSEHLFKKIPKDVHISYDDEVDAFYLRLIKNESSMDQRSVDGVLVFDESMHLAAMRANLK